jgi:hypothetical protein
VLAPRAAAFEKRVKRVVGFSIFPNFLDVLLSKQNIAARGAARCLIALNQKRLINAIFKRKMKKDPMVDWGISHALYAYDAQTPYDLMRIADKFQIKDIGRLIKQDFLLLGAREDHFIPYRFYKKEIEALPDVHSLTFRLFTEEENAGTHCSAGNVKLVLDFITDWLGAVKNIDGGPNGGSLEDKLNRLENVGLVRVSQARGSRRNRKADKNEPD